MFIFHEYFAAGDAGITQYTQRKSKYPNNLKEKVIWNLGRKLVNNLLKCLEAQLTELLSNLRS